MRIHKIPAGLAGVSLAIVCLSGRTGLAGAVQDRVTRPDFSAPARLAAWDLDGSGTWEIANGLLVLSKAGVPAGAIRRPAALAILKGAPAVRVTVETEMRSTAPLDVANRDLEIVFGYESPTRFYYVHLAGITNDVHNGVFLVDNADRKRIDDGKTPPQLTDQAWHRARLERDGSTGRIQVFVDGAAKPAWDLTNSVIRAGRVGLGSFDDTGEFRGLTVTVRDK
jgi:hypothetical protein